MIFKHVDQNDKFILVHPTTRLLYSLQLPQMIYAKMKKNTDGLTDYVYPDIKEQIIDMLKYNHGYDTTYSVHEIECKIKINIDYPNDIYTEQVCEIELIGKMLDDYSILPIEILGNLTTHELFMHMNKKNLILQNEIEELKKRLEYIGAPESNLY